MDNDVIDNHRLLFRAKQARYAFSMSLSIYQRIEALEYALQYAEGARYLLHDLIIRLIRELPQEASGQMIAGLLVHADQLDLNISVNRISGYRDFLESMIDELADNPGD